MKKEKILEWSGVITAIVYSILVAMNIGAEFLGFTLLLISAILIGLFTGVIISRILNQLVMTLDISTKTSFPETLVISWIYVIVAISILSILYFVCSTFFSLISTMINVSESIKKAS